MVHHPNPQGIIPSIFVSQWFLLFAVVRTVFHHEPPTIGQLQLPQSVPNLAPDYDTDFFVSCQRISLPYEKEIQKS